ncbi:MAG: DAK2 domain-containing protein [Lachnospiraceae bacterium]|nr:DAK2 domain-containing protein [Lachnospiraceae bacterium]
MLVAGANLLEANKKLVDEMNVFPVPDGDTGTNMSLTVTSAVKEVLKTEQTSAAEISKALSSGALRGARGNSGVIVSQLFRGFSRGLTGCEDINAVTFATAMENGVETAYKAVMKPKEGTILTVAKAAATRALEVALQSDDIEEVLTQAIEYGEEILLKTPDMLPVLKEAGVVDAGGKGLLFIYHGMLEALKREDDMIDPLLALTGAAQAAAGHKSESAQAVFSTEAIEFGYCTEFIVDGVKDAESREAEVREYLSSIGDSLVVVADGELIKVHVHTNDPGLAIQKGVSMGSLSSIKVDNMRLQHQNILDMSQESTSQEIPQKEEPRKEIGFITISVGEGLKNIFKELGVDQVISGGQTMNPSTEDILEAAQKVNADHVFVLPNNKNIILAAQQAAELLEDKQLHVIPTKSVPQGISAMISYMPGENAQANEEQMKESLELVVSGSVTYAVRDTHMGEFSIKAQDILALMNEDICKVGQELMQTTEQLIDEMISDTTSILTVYYGEEATQQQAEELQQYIEEKYPEVEVEIQEGGQPLYYFLLSAE